MAAEAQLCPQCGAPIHFSVLQAELVCPFCGTTVANPAAQSPAHAQTQDEINAEATRLLDAINALEIRLKADGVLAPGEVVATRDLNINISDNAGAPGRVTSLVVEVRPAGGKPYTAATKTCLMRSSVDKYHPGTLVYVKYDPWDPTQFIIDHRQS